MFNYTPIKKRCQVHCFTYRTERCPICESERIMSITSKLSKEKKDTEEKKSFTVDDLIKKYNTKF